MHPLDEIAVGVDEREAATRAQILDRELLHEGGFADAGLAEDVEMREALWGTDAEPNCTTPMRRTPEIRDVIMKVRHTPHSGQCTPIEKAGEFDGTLSHTLAFVRYMFYLAPPMKD
jgi:Fe-S oxidoreductase